MKGKVIAVGALLLVVVVIAWNALFFGPAGESVDKAKQRNTAAQEAKTQLDAELKALRKIAAKGPEYQAKIDRLNSAVPVTADLEGFIRSANELKTQAGVDWVSIQPAEPTGSGPAEIRMQIVVSGGFFQVLDYLNRLEQLRRIVVVDGINVVTAGESGSSGGSGSTPTTTRSSGGAPGLTVTLTSRMFTQAAAPSDGTTKPGSTTPTTAATNGSTSGGTQTTTPATTGGAN